MTNNVALIITPFFWPKLPPLGIAYLSSFLASKNISHSVLDLNIELYRQAGANLKKRWQALDIQKEKQFFATSFPQIKSQIDGLIASGLSHVGLSVFKNNLFFSLDLARYLKSHDSTIRIVFGGPEVFYLTHTDFKKIETQYKDCVDHYVVGEGEQVFYDLVTGKEQEAFVFGKPMSHLDDYPHPDFRQFALDHYDRKKAFALFSSRGCVYRCRFCAECELFKNYRTKTAQKIVDEIAYHLEKGVKWFTFNDSFINGDLDNLEAFCDLVISNKWDIKWDAQFAIREGISKRLLQKMKQSGCFNLFIGLESGSASVLSRMRKGFRLEDAEIVFKLLKEVGLHFEISLIVGFPNETEEEFLETLDFLRKNKDNLFKIAQVNPFVLLEGSCLFVKESIDEETPSLAEKKHRVERMVSFFRDEKIKFTNAFINNLMYQ